MIFSLDKFDLFMLPSASVYHRQFMSIVNRVSFGNGYCSLGCRTIEEMMEITPRQRRRIMRELEDLNWIAVSTVGRTHTIRRKPIDLKSLEAFLRKVTFRAFRNNRLQIRSDDGSMEYGLHESMFESDVPDILCSDDGPIFFAQHQDVGDIPIPKVRKRGPQSPVKRTAVSPYEDTVAPLNSSKKKREFKNSEFGCSASASFGRFAPSEALATQAEEDTYLLQGNALAPNGASDVPLLKQGQNILQSAPLASQASHASLAALVPSADGNAVENVLGKLFERLEVIEAKLDQQSLATPDVTPQPPAPVGASVPVECDFTQLRSLQALVESLAADKGWADDVKPLPSDLEDLHKLAAQVRWIGGFDKAVQYLGWVFSQEPGFVAKFSWVDHDLYLLHCKGAVKCWRLESKIAKGAPKKMADTGYEYDEDEDNYEW